MRLWSTVATQAKSAALALGVVRSRARRRPSGVAAVIGASRGRRRGRSTSASVSCRSGMWLPGLTPAGPCSQRARFVGRVRRARRRRASSRSARCVRSGATRARSPTPRDGVALDAGLRREDPSRRAAAASVGRRAARLALVLLPGVELARRLGDDDDAHPGVLRAAVLGARAEVGARRVGLEPDDRRVARGSRRSCARAAGTQKSWMTSADSMRTRSVLARRDVDLVGRDAPAGVPQPPTTTGAR